MTLVQKIFLDYKKEHPKDTVIINNFRGGIPYDELLQMIDYHDYEEDETNVTDLLLVNELLS